MSRIVAAGDLARLGCCKGGQPYIVPITHAPSGNCLWCFSMPGQKNRLDAQQSKMSLQKEDFASNRQSKSVAVMGRYRELSVAHDHQEQRIHAWSLREKKSD
ncbi:pyridoxamine 5'-phosphate oxidase family protein [Sinorhizobium meliloti]|uniref:pyridoxamine 5'-phosphate oxidase family protein n=1 Tax=Rhizobium meliloti TaxID=382 RepID=UPI001F254AC7|nr:hypothetical protein [Sinorhizobium meliloti]